MKKILLSWSSGKDSAYSLYALQQSNEYEVVGLISTVTEEYNRVSMHSTRVTLLQQQAKQLNLPLHMISIPPQCSNQIYASKMNSFIAKVSQTDISHIAFGDLFLEDIRQYREKQLQASAIQPLFPIWKRNTAKLAKEIINIGIKAIITCIDPKKLDASFAGRSYDENFLNDLPTGIDPCGENGEFHTFVYGAPMFKHNIPIRNGKIVTRDGFVYADIL